MANAKRLPYEDRLDDLLRIYAQTQKTLLAQMQTALLEGDLRHARQRRAQLAAVLSLLDDLGVATDKTARQIVAQAFTESARQTAALIGAHATFDESAFAGISKEAVEALQTSMLGRLRDARATVGRQIEDEYARAGRRATLESLLGANGSRRGASAHVVERLRSKGITSFVDRAGRNWKLEDYARMATRTTTREAVVEGAKARMAAQGITLARVSVSAKPCPICAVWQGRLVSLGGDRKSFEGEAATDLGAMPNGGPPFHPNCRHTLLPVAEDLADGGTGGGGGGPSGGDHIFSGLDVKGTSIESHVKKAANATNKVHARPANLPQIPVEPLNVRGDTYGSYRLGTKSIEVQPPALGSPRPELSFVHELGHALDHLHFGNGAPSVAHGLATMTGDARFTAWKKAIEGSDAVKALRAELAKRPPGRIRGLNYLLMDAELWARSYAQWIATRSGSQLLQRQVRAIIRSEPNRHWSDQDFEPIARELDKLFKDVLR